MIKIYGLKNCDTCRKAWKWLDGEQIDYQFFDLRQDGLLVEQVTFWLDMLGVERLINRRGTTWRKLDDDSKDLADADRVIDLIMRNRALIKRPLIEYDGDVLVGFNEDVKRVLVS